MAVFKSKLTWAKNEGTTDPQEIKGWKTINARISQELKNNQMIISLQNDFGRAGDREWNVDGELVFKIGDIFNFWAKYDVSNNGLNLSENSPDLVFIGDLREIDSEAGEKSVIKLTCTDRTFNLLNRIGWANYKANGKDSSGNQTEVTFNQGWTAPLMIQDIIKQRGGTNRIAKSKNEFIYDNQGNLTPSSAANTENLILDARLFSQGGFIQDNRSISLLKTIDEATGKAEFITRSIGTPDTDLALFPTLPASTQNYNFPFKGYTSAGKPVYEMMQNLSQLDMTNTEDELDPDVQGNNVIIRRSMKYYFDERNRFHWFYPTDNIDNDKNGTQMILSMGTTTPYEIKSHKLKFSLYDVVNFVYFEAGKDMNGNSILGFRYDPTSGAPTLKDSKRQWPKIAQNLKDMDLVSNGGNITINPAEPGGYDYPASYGAGIVPKWNTEKTIHTDAEYNREFKAKVISLAYGKADSIISTASSQKWKGPIEFQFFNFSVTDLMQYTSEAGGIKNQLLRITDIQHNFQKSGAFSTLSVEQDSKELAA